MNREQRRALERAKRKGKPKQKPSKSFDPVTSAILKKQIVSDINSMQTDAMLHALIGANDAKLIDNAGRVAFIASESVRLCKIEADNDPDMRIVAGMANALYDLSVGHGDKQIHKQSIASGLNACQRLLEQCSPWAIGISALKVDELINSAQGLTVAHITEHHAQTHFETSE